jgi:lysozyme family protein
MAYSERFDKFIPFVLEAECVFRRGHYGDYAQVITERVRGDNGGDTYAGIDRASHPHFDFDNPTIPKAKDVYWQEWQGNGIEGMAHPLGEAFWDTGVNAGYGRARRILAKSGPDVGRFLDEREAFYRRLAEAVPHDRGFLQGWLNRVESLRKFLGIG